MGAVTINTAVTFASFLVVFTALALVTWPEVPWGWVMGITLAVNLVVPVVFYPFSKTLWLAFEMGWRPLEREELEAARRRVADA